MARRTVTAIKEKLDVDPALLHPNPWNYNQQSERVQEATRESIGRFGFIDPVTVRVHPEIEGHYQVIDGEHRWRAATDLGLKLIAVNVIDVSDAEAKKLTIVLNEVKGTGDKVDLAVLLADLKTEVGDDLLTALPYTQSELDELVGLAAHDWRDGLDGKHDGSGEGGGGEDDEDWETLTMRVPDSVHELWLQAKGRLMASGVDLHESDGIANGQVLEALLADYLAG